MQGAGSFRHRPESSLQVRTTWHAESGSFAVCLDVIRARVDTLACGQQTLSLSMALIAEAGRGSCQVAATAGHWTARDTIDCDFFAGPIGACEWVDLISALSQSTSLWRSSVVWTGCTGRVADYRWRYLVQNLRPSRGSFIRIASLYS